MLNISTLIKPLSDSGLEWEHLHLLWSCTSLFRFFPCLPFLQVSLKVFMNADEMRVESSAGYWNIIHSHVGYACAVDSAQSLCIYRNNKWQVPLTDASQTAAWKHSCQVQTSKNSAQTINILLYFFAFRDVASAVHILSFKDKCSPVCCALYLHQNRAFFWVQKTALLYSDFDNNMQLRHMLFWGKCPFFLTPQYLKWKSFPELPHLNHSNTLAQIFSQYNTKTKGLTQVNTPFDLSLFVFVF